MKVYTPRVPRILLEIAAGVLAFGALGAAVVALAALESQDVDIALAPIAAAPSATRGRTREPRAESPHMRGLSR